MISKSTVKRWKRPLGILNWYMASNSKYVGGECLPPHQCEYPPTIKWRFWSYNEQDKFSSDLWNNWWECRPPSIQVTPPSPPPKKGLILVICLSSFIKIGIKPHQLMLGQAPVITGPHIHYLKNIWQKYIYLNSVKPVTDVQQPSKRPTWIKSQGSTLKMSSGIQICQSHFLVNYVNFFMSCDTHHQTCLIYLPKECSSQVTKIIEK